MQTLREKSFSLPQLSKNNLHNGIQSFLQGVGTTTNSNTDLSMMHDYSIMTGQRSSKGGGKIKKLREEAASELIDLQFLPNTVKRRRNYSKTKLSNYNDEGTQNLTSEVKPLFRKDRLRIQSELNSYNSHANFKTVELDTQESFDRLD